jgi:hypothetical protein
MEFESLYYTPVRQPKQAFSYSPAPQKVCIPQLKQLFIENSPKNRPSHPTQPIGNRQKVYFLVVRRGRKAPVINAE